MGPMYDAKLQWRKPKSLHIGCFIKFSIVGGCHTYHLYMSHMGDAVSMTISIQVQWLEPRIYELPCVPRIMHMASAIVSWWRHQRETFSALLALLCGEFIGHRWIPRTKASDEELWCFLWSTPWINCWVNNREAGDLRRHHDRYDVWKCRLRSGGRLFRPQCVKRKEQAWPLALAIVNLGLWYDAHRYWSRILLSIRLYFILSHFILSHNY